MIALRTAALLAALAALAGCGLRGSPTPAPPIWGEAREAFESDQPRERADEARRAAAARAAADATAIQTDPRNSPAQATDPVGDESPPARPQ